MRILKVKYNPKENQLHIKYALPSLGGEDDAWDEYAITYKKADPTPQFIEALEWLRRDALVLCELDDTFKIDQVKVSGVSFSYGGEKDVMGAVITFSVNLDTANSPMNSNTPHKPSEPYHDGDAQPNECLPWECVRHLDQVIVETRAYLQGERAQQDMGLEDNTAPGAEEIE